MAKLLKGLQMVVVLPLFLMIWLGLAENAGALTPCNDDRGCGLYERCLSGVCKTAENQPCNDDRVLIVAAVVLLLAFCVEIGEWFQRRRQFPRDLPRGGELRK